MKKEKQYIGETFTTTGREKYWAKRFTDAICPPMPINNKPTKVMKKKIIKKKVSKQNDVVRIPVKDESPLFAGVISSYKYFGNLAEEHPTDLIWEIGRDFARVRGVDITDRLLFGIQIKFVEGHGAILRRKVNADFSPDDKHVKLGDTWIDAKKVEDPWVDANGRQWSDPVICSKILDNYKKTKGLSYDEPDALIWEIGRLYCDYVSGTTYMPIHERYYNNKLLGIDVKFVEGFGVSLRAKTFAEGFIPPVETDTSSCIEKTCLFPIKKKELVEIIGKDPGVILERPDRKTIIANRKEANAISKDLAAMREDFKRNRRPVPTFKAPITDSIQLGKYAEPDSVKLAKLASTKGASKAKLGYNIP